MKTVYKTILVSSLSMMLLAGCSTGGGKTAVKKEVGGVSMEVLEGEFVTPSDKPSLSSKDFIAVKVKVANNTKESLNVTSQDFTLYGDDDQVIESEFLFDDTSTVRDFGAISLSKGKSATGYLFYEINPDDNDYEMKLTAFHGAKKVEVTVDFDTTTFADHREDVIDVAKTYVDNVFLNGKEELKPKFELANDLKDAKEVFVEEFISSLESEMSYVFSYYEPSKEQVNEMALLYMAENTKKAEVTYDLKSYFPGTFSVYIKPRVLKTHLSLYDLEREYMDSKEGAAHNDYLEREKAAEEYVFNRVFDVIRTAHIDTPEHMPREGYSLTFIKDGDKWLLDTTQHYNYEYDEIVKVFSGS